MVNDDVISMPDKWEYPWYAAWDLAFHTLAARAGRPRLRQAAARPDAAASATCTRTARSRPTSGTSATSTRRSTPGRRCSLYRTGARRCAARATSSSSSAAFHKLLLNFTWWVNRKDRFGQERLRGRLPRPGQHRRLRPQRRRCPPAATWSRPTAPPGWRSSARTCSRSRVELAAHDPTYEDMALKFVEHFLWIAVGDEPRRGRHGHVGRGGRLLLRRAAPARRQRQRLKVRSHGRPAAALRDDRRSKEWQRERVPDVCGAASRTRSCTDARAAATAFTPPARARRRGRAAASSRWSTRSSCAAILARMLDENEFLSPLRHPLALALPPRASVRLPRRRRGVPGRLPAGRVRHRHVRRQLELARARSGSRSTR